MGASDNWALESQLRDIVSVLREIVTSVDDLTEKVSIEIDTLRQSIENITSQEG